jgi:peptide deformylase
MSMSWKPTPPPFSEFKKDTFRKAAVVSDFIYQLGEHPKLRRPSKEVTQKKIVSKEMQEKFVYLKKCLTTYRKKTGYGRGIAAVQVGIPERFAAVYFEGKVFFIVNPKITKKSKKKYRYSEMCMSANPLIVPVVRPAWIEFSYFDEKGNEKFWSMKDETHLGKILNRVLEHEIDHLDGIVNSDLVKDPRDLILLSDPTFYDSAKFEEIK